MLIVRKSFAILNVNYMEKITSKVLATLFKVVLFT